MPRVQDAHFCQLRPLGFKLKQIVADGNCQFRSVSDQLTGTQSKHNQIRARVVEYIHSHKAEFIDFIAVNASGGRRHNPSRRGRKTSQAAPTREQRERAWSDYLSDISKSQFWGDNNTLQACAHVYGVNIIVYHDTNETTVLTGRNARLVLHVAFHSTYNHYSSVRKIDDALPDSTVAGKASLEQSLNVFLLPKITNAVKAPPKKDPRADLAFLGDEDEESDDETTQQPQPKKEATSQKPKQTTATINKQDGLLNLLTPTSQDLMDTMLSTSAKAVGPETVSSRMPIHATDIREPSPSPSDKSESNKETATKPPTLTKTMSPDPVSSRMSPSNKDIEKRSVSPSIESETRKETAVEPLTSTKTATPKPVLRRMSNHEKDVQSSSVSPIVGPESSKGTTPSTASSNTTKTATLPTIPPLSSLHFRKKSKSPIPAEPPKHDNQTASISNIKEESLKPVIDWRYPERREKVSKKEAIRGLSKRRGEKNQEIRAPVIKRRLEKPVKRWVGKKEDIRGPIKRSREVEDNDDEEPIRGPKKHRRMVSEEDEDPIRASGPKRRRQIETEEDEDPICAPGPKRQRV